MKNGMMITSGLLFCLVCSTGYAADITSLIPNNTCVIATITKVSIDQFDKLSTIASMPDKIGNIPMTVREMFGFLKLSPGTPLTICLFGKDIALENINNGMITNNTALLFPIRTELIPIAIAKFVPKTAGQKLKKIGNGWLYNGFVIELKSDYLICCPSVAAYKMYSRTKSVAQFLSMRAYRTKQFLRDYGSKDAALMVNVDCMRSVISNYGAQLFRGWDQYNFLNSVYAITGYWMGSQDGLLRGKAALRLLMMDMNIVRSVVLPDNRELSGEMCFPATGDFQYTSIAVQPGFIGDVLESMIRKYSEIATNQTQILLQSITEILGEWNGRASMMSLFQTNNVFGSELIGIVGTKTTNAYRMINSVAQKVTSLFSNNMTILIEPVAGKKYSRIGVQVFRDKEVNLYCLQQSENLVVSLSNTTIQGYVNTADSGKAGFSVSELLKGTDCDKVLRVWTQVYHAPAILARLADYTEESREQALKGSGMTETNRNGDTYVFTDELRRIHRVYSHIGANLTEKYIELAVQSD